MRSYKDFHTSDYYISVGDKSTDDPQKVYQVWNRDCQVLEYEDYLLPRTIDTMLEMQSRLEQVGRKYDQLHAEIVEGGDANTTH